MTNTGTTAGTGTTVGTGTTANDDDDDDTDGTDVVVVVTTPVENDDDDDDTDTTDSVITNPIVTNTTKVVENNNLWITPENTLVMNANDYVAPEEILDTGADDDFVVTESPEWYNALADRPTHLGYWKDLIPADLQNDEIRTYVVVPDHGAVVPVAEAMNANDLLDLMMSEAKTVDTYLRNGAVHYPNGALLGADNSNYVLGGHSSKVSRDDNAFGTVFSFLFDMKDGQEIWIYQVEDNGTVARNVFEVNSISQVSSKNTEVLAPEADEAQLTMVTCAPLGKDYRRLVVVAHQVEKDVDFMYEYSEESLKNDRMANQQRILNRPKVSYQENESATAAYSQFFIARMRDIYTV